MCQQILYPLLNLVQYFVFCCELRKSNQCNDTMDGGKLMNSSKRGGGGAKVVFGKGPRK